MENNQKLQVLMISAGRPWAALEVIRCSAPARARRMQVFDYKMVSASSGLISYTYSALQPGEPFLFKLHSPDNFIVGGGHFVRYSALPTSLAWDAFGPKNGVGSLEELNVRVRRYRREDASVDPVIGCNILAEPFFFPRSAWIAVPAGWAPNIVQGKTYDTAAAEGRALWDAVHVSSPHPYSDCANQVSAAGVKPLSVITSSAATSSSTARLALRQPAE